MTKYLFIDNFRGFANVYIPILDVNFLVGQNSTGKTSVMGLLKLLSTPRILWAREFGDSDVNFGHFKDMVSAHSDDQSYFRIGAISEQSIRNAPRAAATLFTYKEEEGLPRLVQFTSTVGARREVSIRFIGKAIWYKSRELPADITPEYLLKDVVPEWVTEHSRDGVGYRKLSMPKGYYNDNRLHLYSVLSLAMQEVDKRAAGHFMGFPGGPELIWIAPIRTKPKRTYDEFQTEFSPEGTHTPYLIRRILQSRSDAEKFHKFISGVGEASGLFQSIKIRKFGRGVTAPFEVDAVVDDKALNLSTVGYGVSQSLPVFVELLSSPPESWFAIQQPEVHLHPRAQAALGDVFFEMAVSDKKRFLVETHSDFTIDRFRMNYRKKPYKLNSQVLFFDRLQKHNTVIPVAIGKDGEFMNPPDSYRSFFIKEEMHVLGL